MRYRPTSTAPGRNRSPDLGSLPPVVGGALFVTPPLVTVPKDETVGVAEGSTIEAPQAEQKAPLDVISVRHDGHRTLDSPLSPNSASLCPPGYRWGQDPGLYIQACRTSPGHLQCRGTELSLA